MARVEIAMQGWGWVVDRHGEARSSVPVTIGGTVYVSSSGTPTISSILTNFDGTIPGWIDPGTYTLTIDGVGHTVEAVSGVGSGGGGGGSPTGAAGGVLGGTYPNPAFAVDMATQAELDAVSANVPTTTQKAALVGTNGTPGSGNAYVTNSDPRLTGGGSGTLPWVNAADYGFAQGASAATIKTSLVNAIAALPSAGGTVVVPDADVTVDVSASAVAIGTKNVRLVGGTNTRIKSSNESTTAGLTMFSLASTGGTLTVEKLRLEGPDVIGTAGSFDIIAVGGAAASGRITAYDCDFAKFTFALRCSSSVNWIGWIEAFNCTFTGYGSSTASMASTPILVNSISTGATGRGVRVRDCEFRSYGLGSSNLFHGMYINTDWDVEVDGCHFISSIGTGYGVQIYDSTGTNTASTHQKISRCHFYAALTSKGVVIANKAKAVVQNCTFDNTTSCVLWANAAGSFGGGGEVLDCVFTGVNASGTATIDQTGATSGDQGVRVARCRFTGSAAALISCGPGYWTVEDNEFTPSSAPTTCIDASLALTRLTVKGNRFRGSATQWIWVEAGGTVIVQNNYFWQTAGTAYRNSSTATVQRIVGNDFSQAAGSGVLNSSTPATYQAKGNYGSVGLTDV